MKNIKQYFLKNIQQNINKTQFFCEKEKINCIRFDVSKIFVSREKLLLSVI